MEKAPLPYTRHQMDTELLVQFVPKWLLSPPVLSPSWADSSILASPSPVSKETLKPNPGHSEFSVKQKQ